jgi:dUTP pyrophosphatase
VDPSAAPITVQVVRLEHAAGLDLPAYQTGGSAGMDLLAAVDSACILAPMERKAVPTGLAIAIPAGCEGQVRPRSGLALTTGLTVANAPGTIDSDFRGELKVILVNLGQEPVTIVRGERIAQLVFAPVLRACFRQVEALSETPRGAGGFGHTGR